MKTTNNAANARLAIKYVDDNTALVSKAFAKNASSREKRSFFF